MTRPLTPDEKHLLDHLTRTCLTVGQYAALHPDQARNIRNTAARAIRALGATNLDHAIQIHRTQAAAQPYVWCFDHGRIHNFSAGVWCTAWWVRLAGATEPEALADKAARFGDARFYDQLPFAVQVQLADAQDRQENQ